MKKEVIPYCPGPGMHQMAIEPHCTAVMGEYGWVEEDSFEKYVDRDREIAYRQYPHEPRIPDRVSKE